MATLSIDPKYNSFKILTPHSNIDFLYGPYFIGKLQHPTYSTYDSIGSLYSFLSQFVSVGFTVGIVDDNDHITEYWINNNRLEEKGIQLELNSVSVTANYTVESNGSNTVTVEYTTIGSSLFQSKAVALYDTFDGRSLIIDRKDFNKNGDTFVIENVESGRHIYKIIITDIFGNSVNGQDDVNIGDYKIKYDISGILNLAIISSENLVGKSIKVEISIINDQWSGQFYLSYGSTNTPLNQGTNNISITKSIADNMDGESVYIKVVHGSIEQKTLLFNVLGQNTLYVETTSILPTFYYDSVNEVGVYRDVLFLFKSGSKSMIVNCDDSSDFAFANGQTINFDTKGEALIQYRITPRRKKDNAKIVFSYLDNKLCELPLGNILEKPELQRENQWNDVELNSQHILTPCYIDFSGVMAPNNNPSDPNHYIIKFNDKMYITNDVIHVDDIEIATPLNEEVYIGLGYKLQDTNQVTGNTSGYYNCICVNGTIVKISRYNKIFSNNESTTWDDYQESPYIIFKEQAGTICNGYYQTTSLFNTSSNKLLCEENYELDGFNDDKDIPVLFLEGIDYNSTVVGNLDNVWKSGFVNSYFGSITGGKYNSESNINYAQGVELLKITEGLKKLLQKKYGVLCRYTFDSSGKLTNPSGFESGNINHKQGYLIAYTQGTSTLSYTIPNFKLFFQGGDSFQLEVATGETFNENILTIKADYMESSHLNNTPTAMLYNSIVNDPEIITPETASPSIQYNSETETRTYSDAIAGIPIKVMIKDRVKNDPTEFKNFGSFMLNTDKISDSLGFIIDGYSSQCISIEGTSNVESGSASRFLSNEGPGYDDITSIMNNTDPTSITRIRQYLSKGFEYRYPEGENIYEEGVTYNDMTDNGLDEFYDMWKFVTTSDANTNFASKFNLEYCYLYIIFMMVFGQTDNLGKNCMFDCWKKDGQWGKWFPRPYDLDSQCGLNNVGLEIVPPFVQINSSWVLGDSSNVNNEQEYKYKYMSGSKIFGYASPNSVLWTAIYTKYKSEIESMYSKLRRDKFDYDNLIQHYENVIINKIPISQYNIDFQNKYLGAAEQHYMLGNRWTNFRDWLKARLAFCDTFFNYKSVSYNLGGKETLSIKYIFPSYLRYKDSANNTYYYFGDDISASIGPEGASANCILSLSDSIVTSTNLYSSSKYMGISSAAGDVYEFSNLLELTLGGRICPNLNKCNVLAKLEITSSYSGEQAIDIPRSVTTFICNNDNVNAIGLENSEGEDKKIFLEEFTLRNNNQNMVLDFSNCPYLKKIVLENCVIKKLILAGNRNIETFENNNNTFTGEISISNSVIQNLDLSGQTIASLNFSGDNLSAVNTIERLDLFGAKFTSGSGGQFPVLNLTKVSGLKILNLVNVSGIERVITNNLTELQKFGIYNSSIKYFNRDGNQNNVDLSVFPDTNNIKCILKLQTGSITRNPVTVMDSIDYRNGTYFEAEYQGLNFCNTHITSVVIGEGQNIVGTALFANCKELTTITCSGNCSIKSDWVFYGCTSLTSIPNGLKLKKFLGAYVGSKLNYSTIENSIDSNADRTDTEGVYQNVDFTWFLGSYQGNSTQFIINTSNYPGHIIGLSYFFASEPAWHDSVVFDANKSYNITINGKFSGTSTKIQDMFHNYNTNRECKITFGDNIIDSPESITELQRLFYRCTVVCSDFNGFFASFNNLRISKGTFAFSKICSITSLSQFTNTKLRNMGATFHGTTFYSDTGVTKMSRFPIDNIFANLNYTVDTGETVPSDKVLIVDCCFYDCPQAYIDYTLNCNSNIDHICIGGLLGLSARNNDDAGTKVLSITSDSKYRIRSSTDWLWGGTVDFNYESETNSSNYGAFRCRKCTSDVVDLYGQDLSFYCYGLNAETGVTINISNTSNIGCICAGPEGNNATNGVSVTISNMPSNASAIKAFKNTKFSSSQQFNNTYFQLDNIANMQDMFSGSNINRIDFTLPDSVSNIEGMFASCTSLYSGLPNGFFPESSSLLRSISRLFYKTRIIQNQTGDINESRIIEIPTYIENASSAFAVNYQNDSSKHIDIDFGNSNHLSNISGIFATSMIDVGSHVQNLFNNNSGKINADYAFMNYTDYSFVDFSKLNSIIGMFYNESPTNADWNLSNNNDLNGIMHYNGAFFNWTRAAGSKYVNNISTNPMYWQSNLTAFNN